MSAPTWGGAGYMGRPLMDPSSLFVTTTSTTSRPYPCDRGTGWPASDHHFQLSPGATVAVCVFCGKVAPNAVPASAIEEDG